MATVNRALQPYARLPTTNSAHTLILHMIVLSSTLVYYHAIQSRETGRSRYSPLTLKYSEGVMSTSSSESGEGSAGKIQADEIKATNIANVQYIQLRALDTQRRSRKNKRAPKPMRTLPVSQRSTEAKRGCVASFSPKRPER